MLALGKVRIGGQPGRLAHSCLQMLRGSGPDQVQFLELKEPSDVSHSQSRENTNNYGKDWSLDKALTFKKRKLRINDILEQSRKFVSIVRTI